MLLLFEGNVISTIYVCVSSSVGSFYFFVES